MTAIYAIIDESSFVVNIVLWDGKSTWSPLEGQQAIKLPKDSAAGIGWSYADGVFTPPPSPEE